MTSKGATRASPGVGDGRGGSHLTGFGTPAYRSYVLTVLMLIYILNFVDRSMLSVVARPMKADLQISDTAFGLLTGFGFAFLYTIVGLPLARIAETRNRVWIMSICIALWSIMTAACGFSRDVVIGSVTIGGFWILLTCRIGVGIGEAGCTPPANSLIADYYPPAQRAAALGYYAMGVTLGTAAANVIGGPITDMFDWRTAFYVVGLPGLAVALLLQLTIKEPPRGYTDPPHVARPEHIGLRDAIRELLSKPSYWWMTVGATLAAFCGYGIISFQSLFLQRTFDLSAGQASVYFTTPASVASAAGTFVTGWLAVRLIHRSETAIAWLPGIGLLISAPIYWWTWTTSSEWVCFITLAAGGFIKYGYLAAQYTIGQGVVPMRVRATAIAVMLFLVNLLGYGLGPLFAGVVSDLFFRGNLVKAGYYGIVNRSMCDAAQEATNVASRAAGKALAHGDLAGILAGLKKPVTEAQYAFCNVANASSTEYALLTISAIYAVAGAAFLICARYYKKDLVAR